MIEHWYEILPAAWFTPEGGVWVALSLLILIALAFCAGYLWGRNKQ